MTHGAGTNGRIRCAACGTEQEAPDAARGKICLICGQPLAAGERPVPGASPAVAPSNASEAFDVREGEASEVARELPPEAPVTRSEEVEALLTLERRTTSLLALVPVWGTWRIWTSESHGLFERIVLAGLSLLITAALGIAAFEMIPDEQDLATVAIERVESDLGRLEELLFRYRDQYGKWPDAGTWSESVERGDPRFRDPWGRAYLYSPPDDENGPVVRTLGRDGIPGGAGADRDLSRAVGQDGR